MSTSADVTLGPVEPAETRIPAKTTLGSSGLSESPGAQIGYYKLLQQLGEGGFGTVWMAEQQQPVQRKVALKIIKLGMDTREVIARFEAERQALAMMDHPHIARVLDAGATNAGRPFFVMELVKGDPITEYCDRNKLPMTERLELFVQVCQAVQHAHTKGIIHRDLKPSNVLVSTQDGKPHAKVIDFGIAKATASRLTEKTLFTQHQQLIGTPEYMSPEQAEGSLDIDTRTDVYSLGVLLYELMTGSTPFEGKTLRTGAYAEMQRIIREVDPPKPSTRISTMQTLTDVAAQRHVDPGRLKSILRGELDWIAMKALEKDRQRRYETANGLAMDVKRYLSGEAVLAAPPSTAYKMRKFVRRHKHAVSGAVVVAAALVLGVVGTTWGLVEARQQEREARAARDVAERRLTQLERGTELLMGMFTDLDLQRVKASGVSLEAELGERLAAAASQLDGESIGDPLVVASLQERMGMSLSRLGHAAPAADVLEKSVQTRRATLGDAHPDTLASMHHLAASYNGLGRVEEAVKLGEEVVKQRSAALGPQDPETLKSMSNLGFFYARAGRRDEALNLRERVLEMRREALGPDHPDTLASMQSLANSYFAVNRLPEALTLLEETRLLLRRKLGADHPQTLVNMSVIASTYANMGRHADAVKLYEETLVLQRRRLGADHPNTLQTMHNLAGSYKDMGRHADARRLYEETLSQQRNKLGPDHPDTLATMGSLALSYAGVGDYEKAAKLQEETLSLQRAKLGGEHPDSLTSMGNLTNTYKQMKRYPEALALGEETLALATAAFGADDPMALVCKHNIADIYSDMGRHEDALRIRTETAAAFKQKLGPEHPYSIIGMGSMASSYHELGRVQEALELREQTLAALKGALGPEDPQTLKGMYNLALSYIALGRHDSALELSQQTLALRTKQLGAAHLDTLASAGMVAACLQKLERSSEALKILEATFLAVAGHEADPALRRAVVALRVIDCHLRGDAAGAGDAVERLAALPNTDHRSLYELACCTARLASTVLATDPSPAGQQHGGEVAARAIALLKRAVAAGYRNAPYLAQEPALDGLRDREDFRMLVSELAQAGTAGAR